MGLSNPAYGKLHDPSNVALIDCTKCCVTIAPATIARNKFTKKTKDAENYLTRLSEHHTEVELHNAKRHFPSAEIESTLALTLVDKTKKQMEGFVTYDNTLVRLGRLHPAGAWASKYYEKLPKDTLMGHATLNKGQLAFKQKREDGNFYVNQAWKRGGHGAYASDFYTIIPKDKQIEVQRSTQTDWVSWAFETAAEAENFINYLKTKFARFMLSLYKTNAHIDCGELASVPWVDYSRNWTDEELFEHFETPEEDRVKILEFIPDYY